MRIRALIAAVLMGTAALPNIAATDGGLQLFLHKEGCGATAEPGYLDKRAFEDGYDGCGTIGGLPINEVIYQVDGPTYEAFDTTKSFTGGRLDATTDATGQIRQEAWFGDGTPGGGQMVVELELTAKVNGTTVTLGSTEVSAETGGIDGTNLEYTIDIDDAYNGGLVSHVTLNVSWHGANVNNGNLGLSGDSWVTLPIS